MEWHPCIFGVIFLSALFIFWCIFQEYIHLFWGPISKCIHLVFRAHFKVLQEVMVILKCLICNIFWPLLESDKTNFLSTQSKCSISLSTPEKSVSSYFQILRHFEVSPIFNSVVVNTVPAQTIIRNKYRIYLITRYHNKS
jgi:hypothetical protein